MNIETKVLAGGAAAIGAVIAVAVWISQPSWSEVMAPDGKPALLVECSSPGGCIRLASEICPSGYNVVSRSEQSGTVTTFIDSGNGVLIPVESPTYSGAVMIRCSL